MLRCSNITRVSSVAMRATVRCMSSTVVRSARMVSSARCTAARHAPVAAAASFSTMRTTMNRTSVTPRLFSSASSASAAAASAAASAASQHLSEPVAQEETPLTETVRDFLDPSDLYNMFSRNDMDFYTGVPDSLLKDFCAYVTDTAPPHKHVIAANEGAAIGIASGYHLATRRFPIVYMQNSGFGNAVNPLLSLADPKIYSIPMLLLIGWRGEPGKKDEPQHMVQGKVMMNMLTDMRINFEVLPDYEEGAQEALSTAISYMSDRKSPYALLVKRQCFTKYKLQSIEPNENKMSREDAIKLIVDNTNTWDAMVATTGFASRELYEYREELEQDHSRDFLTVGSMGHSSAIAAGIALAKPSRQVVTLDGDGAMLMHMGSLATIGTTAPAMSNFKHILFNNGAHDSVGGQPTRGFDIDFRAIAKACGYKDVFRVSDPADMKKGMKRLHDTAGPVLMEVMVNKGARSNLGRPKSTPVQNKHDFMHFLQG
jgi:phosphonopyruvate decarboxylase